MRPILYIETSFALAVARGQDPDATGLAYGDHQWLDVGFPTICFMEALSVLNVEKKQSRAFGETLARHGLEYARDEVHHTVSRLGDDLIACSTRVTGSFEFFRDALCDCLLQLSGQAPNRLCPVRLLPTLGETVVDALAREVPGDWTDSLILSSIISHARDDSGGPKAFLSHNRKDFDDPDIHDRLARVGVRYFWSTKSALGWLRSQLRPDTSAETNRPEGTSEPTE